MISVAEASAIVTANCAVLDSETIAVTAAAGRVLAQAVCAERDQPPFDRATMDGVAVAWQPALGAFRRTGTQFAGEPPQTLSGKTDAIEIMTGASLPDGADTIVPVERYTLNEQTEPATLSLEPGYAPERGQFIHRRGSDHRAGSELLTPGTLISSNHIAILASAGLTEVAVNRTPAVAVVATGDELVAAGQPIKDHQIRLSNGPALIGALTLAGYAKNSLHHLPDSKDLLATRLAELLRHNDVLVLSGGVSKGKADYVPDVLTALGVERLFHGVAQRPGKPLWFGIGPARQLVFALPGNPVSALTCFRRYAMPALHALSGRAPTGAPTARLSSDWQFKPALSALLPVVIRPDNQGQLWAAPIATNTSGDFTAIAESDGFIQLPAERDAFSCGEAFPFFAWSQT